MENTYQVPEMNLPRLEEKIARLSRKAQKLGGEEIGLEVLASSDNLHSVGDGVFLCPVKFLSVEHVQ